MFPTTVVGKPRVQCLEDRRVREGTLNFPVLVALSPGTFCWPVSSRPSALNLCPFLLLNSSSAEPGPFLTCYRGHVMGMWWACDGHVKGFWWICDGHMKDMWWAYDGHVMGKLVLLFQSNYDIDICLTFYFLGGGRDGCLGYKKNMRGKEKPICLQFLGPAPLCCVLVDIICQENHLAHPDNFRTPQIFGGKIRIS